MTAFLTRLETLVFLGLVGFNASAQVPAGSLLVVEATNFTSYYRDVGDYSLLATRTSPTAATQPRNFSQEVLIGDIVTVNNRRVKGTAIGLVNQVSMRPDPPTGMAVADITRNNWTEWYFEILGEDGQQIGSIRVSGISSQQGFGLPPPGQTSQIIAGSYTVIGGNGAFLGARGYMGAPSAATGGQAAAVRRASMAEDPASRRINASGNVRQAIYILPMTRPEIIAESGQPVIVHASDHTLVTAAKPAMPGEILTLYASGLGPTRPGVEPGQPFPAGSAHLCNSPVDVLVNGKPGDVHYCGGYPGAIDRYQVNFRVPEGVASGSASVQLTAAWIEGGAASIRIE
jgi:uncharacterized protein (TIGR03437 family)